MNLHFSDYRKIRWQIWTLLFLIATGVFLRTYHIHEWLIFASDQARDLKLVANVVNNNAPWPLLGPDMTGGRGFRLGAIYYYFQILSAKMFGVGPVQQAYPDIFFSLLSLPLLYYFLRRMFSENAALFATATYVVSFFSIEYSRFAWNVNLIPFFVLLFILSFGELFIGGTQTKWRWIILAGIALGVGIQLHAILIFLLLALCIVQFVFLLIKDWHVWRKCLMIVGISFFLNIGQLISEQRNHFANTKTFFDASVFKEQRTDHTLQKDIALDVACNAQANMHILTSLGNQNICDFLYMTGEQSTTYKTPLYLEKEPLSLLGKFVSLLVWLLGYGLLLRAFYREQDAKKKYFFGLMLLYGVVYFLVMLPIAPGSRFRYFLPIIFMPFVSLALLADFLKEWCLKKYFWIIWFILILLVALNIHSIRSKIEGPLCDISIQKNFGCNVAPQM